MVAPHAGARIEIPQKFFDAYCIASLPTRERGLKSAGRYSPYMRYASLPTRERGLKYLYNQMHGIQDWSLPTRERGLKSRRSYEFYLCHGRSPRGSAD